MASPRPTPRAKKTDAPGTGPRFGSPFAYVLILLVGFLFLRTLFQDAGFPRVAYSRLLERVKSDGCVKIAISNDWVRRRQSEPQRVEKLAADAARRGETVIGLVVPNSPRSRNW